MDIALLINFWPAGLEVLILPTKHYQIFVKSISVSGMSFLFCLRCSIKILSKQCGSYGSDPLNYNSNCKKKLSQIYKTGFKWLD